MRHFHTGYGIIYCDSMKHKVILHWITMKYSVSRMKMPHVRECAISLIDQARILWQTYILNKKISKEKFTWKKHLPAHNWQKWKSRFLTRHRHKIYGVEVFGLSISNYTYKITTFFVNMWNLGQFRKNLIFCQ